MLGTSGRCL